MLMLIAWDDYYKQSFIYDSLEKSSHKRHNITPTQEAASTLHLLYRISGTKASCQMWLWHL
jgi:hypothetical protein